MDPPSTHSIRIPIDLSQARAQGCSTAVVSYEQELKKHLERVSPKEPVRDERSIDASSLLLLLIQQQQRCYACV